MAVRRITPMDILTGMDTDILASGAMGIIGMVMAGMALTGIMGSTAMADLPGMAADLAGMAVASVGMAADLVAAAEDMAAAVAAEPRIALQGAGGVWICQPAGAGWQNNGTPLGVRPSLGRPIMSRRARKMPPWATTRTGPGTASTRAM